MFIVSSIDMLIRFLLAKKKMCVCNSFGTQVDLICLGLILMCIASLEFRFYILLSRANRLGVLYGRQG